MNNRRRIAREAIATLDVAEKLLQSADGGVPLDVVSLMANGGG